MVKKVYRVENLDCANCASKVEAALNALPEVQEAVLTYATMQLRITAEDPDALLPKLQEVAQKVEPGVEFYPRDGAHSHGGEAGHVIIDPSPDARMCGCGWRGHLEAYASATAVIRRTQEALDAGRPSSLSARVAAGEELTPKLVAEEAERGDSLSNQIISETARYLGIGTVSVMHVVDPAVVLLGGAMTFGGRESSLGRRFLAEVDAVVRQLARPVLARDTVLDFATLGGDAGYIGAAGVARLAFKSRTRS